MKSSFKLSSVWFTKCKIARTRLEYVGTQTTLQQVKEIEEQL
jgi:hypothetical protein